MSQSNEIRKRFRAERNAIEPATRARWSKQICDQFVQLDSYKSSHHIAAFLASDGEADPIELMRVAVEDGKQVFVPIVVGKAKPLKFAPWQPDCEMRENRFGIFEPAVEKSDWIEASELDFVVTPLVAFDERCNRIGVGGGYYDRSFAYLKQTSSKATHLVGFAFELQRIETIQPKSWDVSLEAVVTESKVYAI